jgi:hypothetical protein
VELDRLDTHEKLRRHLSVAHPGRNQPGHRALLCGQPGRIEVAALPRDQTAAAQFPFTPVEIGHGLQHRKPVAGRSQVRRRPPLSAPAQCLPVGQLDQGTLKGHRQPLDLGQGPFERVGARNVAH